MLTRHKHTTYAWRNTHTSHTRTPTSPRVIIQTENTAFITLLPQIYNILQHSKAEKLSITTVTTQQTFSQTPHHHYNRHKTNMRHINTSFVSRHLATRGNNKILCTPPPHIRSSEEILPRLTRRTLAQLRINKSPFLKLYLYKVNAKSHPSPQCPLCNTHTHIISSTAPTYAPHCHPWICGQTPLEWLHCWSDGQRSWLVDYKRGGRTHPH